MRTPTLEQQAVLDSTSRIRLVRAAPGSGKTWMVAEAIRTELHARSLDRGGIAALSFTRVGGDEIQGALGFGLSHPHFVGTIDAFLFRYVVRPHLQRWDKLARPPELISSDWRPAEIWTSTLVGNRINPYACVWAGRDAAGVPVLARLPKFGGGLETLSGDDRDAVIKFKRNLRQQRGRITISDSALIASTILQNENYGPVIRTEIMRRFRLLIVDELQDTGVFLGESIRALLGETDARALLVGDPDQAIYEFNGAEPKMFDTFAKLAGAVQHELMCSRRCPAAIAASASHLKRSGGELHPATDRVGRSFLLRYESMVPDVAKVARMAAATKPGEVIKVVTRSNATVLSLTGRSSAEVPSLHCRPVTLLHRSVQQFRRCRPIAALAAARAAMEQALLGSEGLTDEELVAQGIAAADLKALAIRSLLAANSLPVSGTVIEWQIAAEGVLCREIDSFCEAHVREPAPARNKPGKHKGFETLVSHSIPCAEGADAAFEGIPVTTVHGVKGETHDVTVFVVPPTAGKAAAKKCPSLLWWPGPDSDDEERRIAYVAMTRSRGDLIVCVDNAAYDRLVVTHPEFVAAFEQLTVDEFVNATLGTPQTAVARSG